jgi:hypothetical protein
MSAESILMVTVLITGAIGMVTGTLVVVGLLRIARGGGIRQPPAFSMPGVAARDRVLRARLRARYHGRWGPGRAAVFRPLTGAVPGVPEQPSPVDADTALLSADPANPAVAV